MSLSAVGGNLFSRHPQNMNHVNKDINELLSVVFMLGTNVNGGETVFKWNDN